MNAAINKMQIDALRKMTCKLLALLVDKEIITEAEAMELTNHA